MHSGWEMNKIDPDVPCGSYVPPLSMRRNFLWSFVGYTVYGLSQWVLLIVLARFCDPEAVGQFALGLAVTAPILFLLNMNLRGVQATDATGEYHFSEYMAVRLATTPIGLGMIAAFVWAMGYPGRTSLAVILVGIAKSIEAITDIQYGLFQRHERMDIVCASIVSKGVLSVALMGGFLLLVPDLLFGLIGLCFAWLLVGAFFDLPQSAKLASRSGSLKALIAPVRPGVAVRLVCSAIPLGATGFLGSLQASVPRLIIERSLTTRDVGIFSALAYFLMIGSRIVLSINQSTSARQAIYLQSGRVKLFLTLIARLILINIALGAAGIAVAALAGEPLLRAIYGPDYAQHSGTFLIIMASGALVYVSASLEHSCTAARIIGAQAPILLAAVVTLSAACVLMVPQLGIAGAAIAMLAAAAVQLVGYSLALRAGLRRHAGLLK